MNPFLIILLVVLSLVLIYLIVCIILFAVIHKKIFGVRCTDPDLPLYIVYDDYKDFLDRTEYETEVQGKKIRGYVYQHRDHKDFKGFIILSHGMFGTHVQYLFDIALLTKNGYQVLAYDQYGVGISEGESQITLSQGILTMESVIADVEKRNLNHDLPLFLYGHSWGAYCSVGAMKSHPEIRAVVALSGPISLQDAAYSVISKINKPIAVLIKPTLPLGVFFTIGAKRMLNATRGPKENKKTKVLLMQAENDTMVLYKRASLAYYYTKHPQDNISIILRKDGGHNILIEPASMKQYSERVKEYSDIMNIKDEKEKTLKKEEFLSSFDKVNSIVYDKEVSEGIISFLNQNL